MKTSSKWQNFTLWWRQNEYVTDLHSCVYTLLSHHVSTEYYSAVIETVLSWLTKKQINYLAYQQYKTGH